MICASCGQHSATSPCDGCDQEPRLDGRFALQAVLGQGSFGTTWRALDATGTPVALKEMLLRPELQERVERELRVLRQLDHPGVPHYIEDFRTRAGRYASQVLVMELIDGQTITQELEERRFGALDVVELVQELAGILVYLHGLSPPVIHRDIKPANVMRRATGGLVLIDFGLVRDTVIATLGGTREVGTIGYQAPEQFAGDPIPASDLYALGAVAVRLLTRREPHELVRALYEPMRWRKHASVPDEVAALIDALVAPEPGDRVGSAAELARWCASLRRGDRSRQAIQQVQHGPATPAEDEVAEGEASHAAPEPAPEESAASRAPPLSGARFASIRPPVRKLPSETYRLAEVDLTMLRVEPGAFEMGSAAGQRGRSDEETMHLVTLEQPFMLGRAPMCQELIHALGGQPRDRRHDPRLPAQSVSWSDAVEICNQLSEMAGLRPAYHR